MKYYLIFLILIHNLIWGDELKGLKLFCYNQAKEQQNPFYFEGEKLTIPIHFEVKGYEFDRYTSNPDNLDEGVGTAWVTEYHNQNNSYIRFMSINDFQAELKKITFYNNECLGEERRKNNIDSMQYEFYPKCIEDILYRDSLQTFNGYVCEIYKDDDYSSMEMFLINYSLKVREYISQEKTKVRDEIKSKNKL